MANFSQYESDSRILDKAFLCLVLWSEATVQGNEVLAFDDSLVFGFFANRDFDNAFDFTRTSVTLGGLPVFYFKNVPVEFLVLFVHLNYLLQQNVCNIFNSFSFLRQTSQDNPDVKSSMKTDLIQFLQSYASPITLSALGFIVPSMFFFFSGLEDWNPRVRVNVDLARYVTRALQGKRTCKGGCFQIWRVYNARMKNA